MFSTFPIAGVGSLPYVYPTMGFHHIGGEATRGKQSIVRNMTFANFQSTGGCVAGSNTALLNIHPEASDLIMEHIFGNITYISVEHDKFMYLMDPPAGWANPTDCGDFPCTAPENVLITFTDTIEQSGSPGLNLPATPFQVIHHVDGAADSSCTSKVPWNAYLCSGRTLATL